MTPISGPLLALTMGEPGGVGPEITVKAYTALRASGPPFFVIADPAVFRPWLSHIVVGNWPHGATEAFRHGLPVLDLGVAANGAPGRADPASAPAVIGSIERAVALALRGEVEAVVTNPIQKASLVAAGFKFRGHTEFLEALTAATRMPAGRPRGAVMMIAGPSLKSVPITTHLSVAEAARVLTAEMIVKKGLIVADALQRDFGIGRPRLAVSGLNPHAGEGGAIGREDQEIIAPAIEALVAAGVDAEGPLPADTMFHAEARRGYDAALCMLHDQALIPAKTLAFEEAVNVTLGLPIVRTSPDHGTGLDIAGREKAQASSLIAAIRLAASTSARRRGAG